MMHFNFKIAWRHIVKGKLYSVINISGLAVGLACSLTIGLYVYDEYSHDRFHQHQKEIYRVVETQDHEGVLHPVAATPGLLADALKRDYPEIRQTCRVSRPLRGILTLESRSIEPSKIIAADNSFFTMFDFGLVRGNPNTVLLKPDEVVITESIAVQLFGAGWKGDHTLLGRQLVVNNSNLLVLAGVAPDCPSNSHLQFDVILSMGYEELQRPGNFAHWENHTYHTYIRLAPEADGPALEQKLKTYMLAFNTWSKPVISLQPLEEIYLHSNFDYGDWVKTSSITHLRIFVAIGVVVLLIAVFNFVNLSTARSTQRALEVGVRKVIGAARRQLVFQFLSETFLITLLSMTVSVLLLFAFVPVLNEVSGKAIAVPLTPYFGLILLTKTMAISVLAGLYPAFLLSGFQPSKALKGFFTSSAGLTFRRALVITQFAFSVVLMLAAIVIYSQLTFIQGKALGFDKEQLIFLRLKNQLFAKSLLLKSDLLAQPGIQSVAAASNNLVDVNASTHSIEWEGKSAANTFPMSHMIVDPDFLSTTGITLLHGRNFDASLSSDSTSWLINETAAKRMGWTAREAIGKSLRLWNTPGTVAGVVKDFHFRPLTTGIEPMLFRYWPGTPRNFQGLLIRTKPDQVRQAVASIEQVYRKHEMQTAPQYEFVDETLNHLYQAEQNTGRTVLYFAILAILVSCLGLFALTTFAAAQRAREIGVRKVFGASVPAVMGMLSRNFLKLVCIAIAVAMPPAWWMMTRWLEAFAYHIDIQWWMMLAVAGLILCIAMITVSFQTFRAASMNPAKSLRTQ